MKIRHFLLLILTLVVIVFCQPLVQLLGGLVLIAGVAAYIYSDLPAEKQAAWDRKIARGLQRLRKALLRRQPGLSKKSSSRGTGAWPELVQPVKKRQRSVAALPLEDSIDTVWPVTEKPQPDKARLPDQVG